MAKEFRWHGKTEDEVKRMDLKTFVQFIPSRSRRSLLTRGLTEQQKILLQKIEKNQSPFKTHCRDMIIVPQMIGKIIHIYNGKEFQPLTITTEMLGHYLGEFSHTRKSVTHSSAGIGATRSSKAISAR